MKKVEHIGIAVSDLSNANQLFEQLFNQKVYKTEMVEEEGVSTSFFKVTIIDIFNLIFLNIYSFRFAEFDFTNV